MHSLKLFSATLILCLISLFASGQKEIKNYIQERTRQIVSIDPENSSFEDLESIGKAIGEARIVMLGEQDHDDAPGYFAKTRLIKYLHEIKGFNVVAYEDDFFNINYNWELVKKGKLHIDSFIKKNISITWSSCGMSSPFFRKYLPSILKTEHPLEISAFDNQTATQKTLPFLDSVMRSLKLRIVQSPEYSSKIAPLLSNWHIYTNDTVFTDRIIEYYTIIKAQMLERLPNNDFWILTVDNLIQENIQFRNWKKDTWKDRNTRDRQMAINLKWIAEVKYPDQKIIVWAHNYHVSKHSEHYPKKLLNEAKMMGSIFTEDSSWKNNTYIIGFTSYEGTAGRTFDKKYKVSRPKSNSFENWISKDYKYAFVDLKDTTSFTLATAVIFI
jgi:erythromycin esterase